MKTIKRIVVYKCDNCSHEKEIEDDESNRVSYGSPVQGGFMGLPDGKLACSEKCIKKLLEEYFIKQQASYLIEFRKSVLKNLKK